MSARLERKGSVCHYCGLFGHWKFACPVGLLCFRCRRQGHHAKNCRAKNCTSRVVASGALVGCKASTVGGARASVGCKGTFAGEGRRGGPLLPPGDGGRDYGQGEDMELPICLFKAIIRGLVEGRGLCIRLEVEDYADEQGQPSS